MTSPILEMIREFDGDYGTDWDSSAKMAFALRIVDECLAEAQSYPSLIPDYAAGIDSVRDAIRRRFLV